ncbi:MAG: TIGR03986 family CRISPR-associated RAMP protein [Anaerolineales bacterium]
MKIPKHSENIRDNRTAKAPYNFVSLPDQIRYVKNVPHQHIFNEDHYTGRIICTLTNSTPMYVRAAQTKEEYEAKRQSREPFYYNSPSKKLLIPGSSIRGMFRTLVEVISQSRLSPVTEKQLFYRSVEDTSMGRTYRDRMKDKVRAGYYHEDKSGSWISLTLAGRVQRGDIQETFSVDSLYENEKPASPRRVPLRNLQHKKVYFQLDARTGNDPAKFFDVTGFSTEKSDSLEEGILVITGDMNNKKREFVFSKRTVTSRIKLDDESVLLFEDKDQLTQYQKHAFNGKRGKGKLQNGDPIFCLLDENNRVLGFGRAFMFRLPYKNSPMQMLPFETEEDQKKYDMAEAMFGYVPQGKDTGRKQLAGRVYVSDAVMQGDISKAVLPETQLKVLSSPKSTSFQNYLTQDNPNNPDELNHYDTSNQKTTLRGHKFYWHKGQVTPDTYTATEDEKKRLKDQLSEKVKPIKEGQEFSFEIRFENLLPEELGALLWVLDTAKDEQYRLKIGMGKPYGLGSVSVGSKVILENRKLRYTQLFDSGKWSTPPDTTKKLNEARTSFAKWVLNKSDASPQEVDDLDRVSELLSLLSWDEHPPLEETRYMTLPEFSGKAGGFTKRAVLPSAFGVWSKHKK